MCFATPVVQLLKSWEYKNKSQRPQRKNKVVQLLKSWEYKNSATLFYPSYQVVQLLKSWEYKNRDISYWKVCHVVQLLKSWEYKNNQKITRSMLRLYSYLNLESTKTSNEILMFLYPHSDYKNNNCPCQSLLSKNFCKSFSSDVWEYLIR